MRGYCARCQEYRSDMGEDAWSILWKRENPICERCGRFVDVNYFVEIRNGKTRNKNYPNDVSPEKHSPVALNSAKNTAAYDSRVVHNNSGISRKERERKKRKKGEISGER